MGGVGIDQPSTTPLTHCVNYTTTLDHCVIVSWPLCQLYDYMNLSPGCAWPSQRGLGKGKELDPSPRAGQHQTPFQKEKTKTSFYFLTFGNDDSRQASVILTISTSPSVCSSTSPASQTSLTLPSSSSLTSPTSFTIIAIAVIIANIHPIFVAALGQISKCPGTTTMRCTPRLWTLMRWLRRIGCSTTPASWRWWLLMDTWSSCRSRKGWCQNPDPRPHCSLAAQHAARQTAQCGWIYVVNLLGSSGKDCPVLCV